MALLHGIVRRKEGWSQGEYAMESPAGRLVAVGLGNEASGCLEATCTANTEVMIVRKGGTLVGGSSTVGKADSAAGYN